MPLKIGIDIRSLCDEKKSGVAEYTENLVENLLKIDKENEYFLFYNSWKDATLPSWNFPNAKFCGFKIPNKILNFGLKFFNFPKIDWLIKEKLDAFLIPNTNFISLSKNCKKIVTVHDLSFEIYPEFFSPKSRLWHYFTNLKKICNEADKIIAVSENTARDLAKIYKIPPEKIKTIYSGIKKTEAQEYDLKRVKEKYNLPENFILYLGNIEPRKNLETLVKALEITVDSPDPQSGPENDKRMNLVIAGALGYKSDSFFEVVEKSSATSNIKILDYVDIEDRAALYKLAKIFIFPSFYEGFGFPPLEAMAQGTPVISSISSSLTETIGNAGILVNPYDAKELAWAIDVLIKNNDVRNEIITRGFEQIKKFDWQKTAEETLDILKNI
jgi:glycosyltransferase involved in cell wall biosynthesis